MQREIAGVSIWRTRGKMKAITLWQPWASLLACGAKEFETRSWPTAYRGPIAIHAAAKTPSSIWADIEHIIDSVRATLGILDPDDLPRGAIIATAELINCYRMGIDPQTHRVALYDSFGNFKSISICEKETLFGDWTPGRYAWEFASMQLLPESMPAKGGQRLWNWEPTQAGEGG